MWRIVMINAKSYVRITDDHSEAWLYLCAPEDQPEYNKAEILEYLNDNKVIVGINESHVAAMCKKKIYEREVKIATSEKGEEGHNRIRLREGKDSGRDRPGQQQDRSQLQRIRKRVQ